MKRASEFSEAIRHDRIDVVLRLLSEEPGLLGFSHGIDKWIHKSARYNSVKVLRELLKRGANPNEVQDEDNTTPLKLATQNRCVEAMQILFDHGADPSISGRLPIYAVVGDDPRSLEAIVCMHTNGVDLSAMYTNDFTGEPMSAYTESLKWDKQDVVEYINKHYPK